MKTTFTIAALGLASVLSFGAAAANLVTDQEVASQNLQAAGTVSVSGIAGTPMDICHQLSEKADRQGATSYRIIEARNGDNYHATAQLYK